MNKSLILFASDHRGYELKSKLIVWAAEQGYATKDLGPDSVERCDAGDFATRLATELKGKPSQFGVLICGTGQAMAMTANRHRGIRAALCCNASVARLSRQHNDANVLVLGADITGEAVAVDCLETFLTTEMLGGRYAQRRDKLEALGGI